MKIIELLNYGKIYLKEDDEGSLKAKILLEHILKVEREYIITHYEDIVSETQITLYQSKLEELKRGKPIQYITNHQEFMKLDFYVDENVLIPQPDTEILVEKVIEILKNKKNTCSVLDICTGSGAIGISIAKYIPKADVYVSDISRPALKIAQKNALKNEVENIHFILSDGFKNINKKDFDIIVSNPPYIETDIINGLPEEVKHEPHLALDGGKDGLDFYRIFSEQSPLFLKPSGYLCLEIGYQQKGEVCKLLKNNFKNIKTFQDYGGRDRVVISEVK